MGDTNQSTASQTAGIDLSQFFQVFFEEAGENLETMEQMLLVLDVQAADDEELNAIFRCAHSVKGGAATFGFNDVAELTHQMEALLDKLRRHELSPTAQMVDVLLAAGDALKAMLAKHQGSGSQTVDTADLLVTIKAMCAGAQVDTTVSRPAAAASAAPAAAAAPAAPEVRQLELTVGALDDPSLADNLVELFKEITDLGTIEPLDAGRSADGMRRFKIITSSSDADLLDLFTFHVPREAVRLGPLTPGYGFHEGAPGAPEEEAHPADHGYGFFDDAPGAPGQHHAASAPAAPAQPSTESHDNKQAAAARPAAPRAEAKPAASPDAATLRVSVEKVDQLINLVGELVITQAMLAQNSKGIDTALHQQLMSGVYEMVR
jgi:two-component system chemotaxis sensor kinase CheA